MKLKFSQISVLLSIILMTSCFNTRNLGEDVPDPKLNLVLDKGFNDFSLTVSRSIIKHLTIVGEPKELDVNTSNNNVDVYLVKHNVLYDNKLKNHISYLTVKFTGKVIGYTDVSIGKKKIKIDVLKPEYILENDIVLSNNNKSSKINLEIKANIDDNTTINGNNKPNSLLLDKNNPLIDKNLFEKLKPTFSINPIYKDKIELDGNDNIVLKQGVIIDTDQTLKDALFITTPDGVVIKKDVFLTKNIKDLKNGDLISGDVNKTDLVVSRIVKKNYTIKGKINKDDIKVSNPNIEMNISKLESTFDKTSGSYVTDIELYIVGKKQGEATITLNPKNVIPFEVYNPKIQIEKKLIQLDKNNDKYTLPVKVYDKTIEINKDDKDIDKETFISLLPKIIINKDGKLGLGGEDELTVGIKDKTDEDIKDEVIQVVPSKEHNGIELEFKDDLVRSLPNVDNVFGKGIRVVALEDNTDNINSVLVNYSNTPKTLEFEADETVENISNSDGWVQDITNILYIKKIYNNQGEFINVDYNELKDSIELNNGTTVKKVLLLDTYVFWIGNNAEDQSINNIYNYYKKPNYGGKKVDNENSNNGDYYDIVYLKTNYNRYIPIKSEEGLKFLLNNCKGVVETFGYLEKKSNGEFEKAFRIKFKIGNYYLSGFNQFGGIKAVNDPQLIQDVKDFKQGKTREFKNLNIGDYYLFWNSIKKQKHNTELEYNKRIYNNLSNIYNQAKNDIIKELNRRNEYASVQNDSRAKELQTAKTDSAKNAINEKYDKIREDNIKKLKNYKENEADFPAVQLFNFYYPTTTEDCQYRNDQITYHLKFLLSLSNYLKWNKDNKMKDFDFKYKIVLAYQVYNSITKSRYNVNRSIYSSSFNLDGDQNETYSYNTGFFGLDKVVNSALREYMVNFNFNGLDDIKSNLVVTNISIFLVPDMAYNVEHDTHYGAFVLNGICQFENDYLLLYSNVL